MMSSFEESVTVKVKGSYFIGHRVWTIFENQQYLSFWNIPYAEAPIGDLRFKDPVLKKMNNGTYIFNRMPKTQCKCYNEDCLYLSVHVPSCQNQKWNLPVLVWAVEDPTVFTPDFFIDEEIIVVTVTYRHSIFGFLNTEDEFSSGNMGAKDILTALEWIKIYIACFYGDPKRITLAGVGNSATLVASMLITPLSENLFQSLIILSGSALSPADYRKYYFDVINKIYWKLKGSYEKLNRTNLYEMLRNYSTGGIMTASEQLFDSTEVRNNQRLINAFGPCVEISKYSFMEQFPTDIYKSGKVRSHVNVIIGYTSLESMHKLKGYVSNTMLLKCLNYNFQYLLPFEGVSDVYESRRYREIRRKIMDFYFVNGTIGVRSLRRYAKYVSDQVIYPLLRQSLLQVRSSSANVYLYRFSFKGSLNIGWQSTVGNLNWSAATAGDEICYLFRCKSVNDVYNSAETSHEKHFIKKIVRLLANFSKSGNPTPKKADIILGNLRWEPLKSEKPIRAMSLKKKFKMVNIPEESRFVFWDNLKNEYFNGHSDKDEL